MGITLAWMALQEGKKEDLLERLGLEEIGETSEDIGPDFAYGETSEGWSILVMKDPPSDTDETMAAAAPEGASLYGFMSETVMFSELRGYVDGRKSWSVIHEPEKDARAIVHGKPPEPFNHIKQELEAEQAAAGDKQVDYLFDLPMELAARLSGYRPAQGGVDWLVLSGKTTRKGQPGARHRSLTRAMKAELLPLLWSLGWTATGDDPRLSVEGEIVREIGTKTQTISFEYGSGTETYIYVLYRTTDHPASGPSKQEAGTAEHPASRVPWWKKFTWSYLRAASAASQAPEDPVDAAIEKAKTEIRAIDDYLKTGTRNPYIRIQGRWTSEKPVGM